MARRSIGLIVVAVAVAALALVGCGRDQPAASLLGTSTFAPAAREAGRTLAGGTLDIADHRGKVVVLKAWASWCGPCVDEVPQFVELAEHSDPANVAIVGLDVSDDSTAAQAFADRMGITYPSIVDADGALLPTIPGVPPRAIPSTVVIDSDGRIAARIVGAADASTLNQIVAGVAAE